MTLSELVVTNDKKRRAVPLHLQSFLSKGYPWRDSDMSRTHDGINLTDSIAWWQKSTSSVGFCRFCRNWSIMQ